MTRIHAFLPGPSETGGSGGNVSQPLATNGYKLHQDAARIVLSGCVVDLEHERVLRPDAACALTTREARLLRYLWERQGQDVSRGALLVEVWGYSRRARSRAVDATVQRLRTKIERDPTAPDHLLTVWGSGYRLVGPDPDVAASSAGAPASGELYGRDVELRTLRDAVLDNLGHVIGPAARLAMRLLRIAPGTDPSLPRVARTLRTARRWRK